MVCDKTATGEVYYTYIYVSNLAASSTFPSPYILYKQFFSTGLRIRFKGNHKTLPRSRSLPETPSPLRQQPTHLRNPSSVHNTPTPIPSPHTPTTAAGYLPAQTPPVAYIPPRILPRRSDENTRMHRMRRGAGSGKPADPVSNLPSRHGSIVRGVPHIRRHVVCLIGAAQRYGRGCDWRACAGTLRRVHASWYVGRGREDRRNYGDGGRVCARGDKRDTKFAWNGG